MEIKAATLYSKLPVENSDIDVDEAVRDSIYEAIGYNNKNKKFKRTVENSFLIKYIQHIAFFKLLNQLEKKVGIAEIQKKEMSHMQEDMQDQIEREEYVSKLLEISGLKDVIAEDLYVALEGFLLQKKDFSEELVPYLDYLAEKKKELIC